MAQNSAALAFEPGLRLVRAPNPSPMTFTGTNTWIVGEGEVAVIDPGPHDAAHMAAILGALARGERITAILVTHAHRDHAALARALAQRTGAPVLAAGDPAGRRRPIMARAAAEGLVGGGEGMDVGFRPDLVLEDGRTVLGAAWEIGTVATPGHTADHLAFTWKDAVFTGDHVMGWASSLVSPPDGDIVAFLTSCERLSALEARVFYPGHGEPVTDPKGRLAWLVSHRQGRRQAVLDALQTGPANPAGLARTIYSDVDPALLPAAERNVLAQLIALMEEGRVRSLGALSESCDFAAI